MFTGDRSGDFLYAALHRAGLASQATSVSRDDGLRLRGVYISSALRCAPPANRPTPQQLTACESWLDAELAALSQVRVMLCLGAIAWDAALDLAARSGDPSPSPRPRFAHGARLEIGRRHVLGSYHVSQQNTFTGRLTPAMFDRVLAEARNLAGWRASDSKTRSASRGAYRFPALEVHFRERSRATPHSRSAPARKPPAHS
jgi:uracil-DNA glycosylase